MIFVIGKGQPGGDGWILAINVCGPIKAYESGGVQVQVQRRPAAPTCSTCTCYVLTPSPPLRVFACHLARLFASRDADATLVLTRATPQGSMAPSPARTPPPGSRVVTRAPTTFPTAFIGTGCFALSVQPALLLHSPPQNDMASDTESFLVPGLPDLGRRGDALEADSREFLNRMFDAEHATTGWVVNLFADLKQRYIEHNEKDTGKQVFTVGPVCLVNDDDNDTLERGHTGEADTTAEAMRVLRWLDTKPAWSVVYVCFSSLTRFPRDQVVELGMGLADSGANFVWVVRDKNATPPLPDIDDTVPGHGLVVGGWASQSSSTTRCWWWGSRARASPWAQRGGYVWGGEALGGVVVGREAVG
ncbi:hypothetical protein BDA96_09G025900 [Sorghum bicolor]|uniref:Uncharacterized protein n=2 Tax=Sorghum bicolor TaxID=4558 RepID=A0A921Q9E2_SORBI|nr:hypothetical protein BDA96_09G025900 [Sorghum bicolor]OQU77292.1 hypothetical protein SORBI_3009G024650 [Sorghum bicolor]